MTTAIAPVICDVAVRLADEGVPLRAIARAVNSPSDLVREHLHAARSAGRLFDLPREDWPPGFPRDQRALQLSRMVVEDRTAVILMLQQKLKLTETEVYLLMTLLQNTNVSKTRLTMSARTTDVHICHIRARLDTFGIAIVTLRGYGYKLSVDGRRKIMDMIIPKQITSQQTNKHKQQITSQHTNKQQTNKQQINKSNKR